MPDPFVRHVVANHRLSFPTRHCATCRCETVSDTTTQEDE